MIREIKELDELKYLLDTGQIGKGTFSTGKFALQQGKPVFVAIIESENND